MSQPDERPKGDPWHAYGYLMAGVLFYGALGWLADRWLGTSFLVAIGILIGAGLGIYLTVARFQPFSPPPSPPEPTDKDEQEK